MPLRIRSRNEAASDSSLTDVVLPLTGRINDESVEVQLATPEVKSSASPSDSPRIGQFTAKTSARERQKGAPPP
jgi:hypothetical protein